MGRLFLPTLVTSLMSGAMSFAGATQLVIEYGSSPSSQQVPLVWFEVDPAAKLVRALTEIGNLDCQGAQPPVAGSFAVALDSSSANYKLVPTSQASGAVVHYDPGQGKIYLRIDGNNACTSSNVSTANLHLKLGESEPLPIRQGVVYRTGTTPREIEVHVDGFLLCPKGPSSTPGPLKLKVVDQWNHAHEWANVTSVNYAVSGALIAVGLTPGFSCGSVAGLSAPGGAPGTQIFASQFDAEDEDPDLEVSIDVASISFNSSTKTLEYEFTVRNRGYLNADPVVIDDFLTIDNQPAATSVGRVIGCTPLNASCGSAASASGTSPIALPIHGASLQGNANNELKIRIRRTISSSAAISPSMLAIGVSAMIDQTSPSARGDRNPENNFQFYGPLGP